MFIFILGRFLSEGLCSQLNSKKETDDSILNLPFFCFELFLIISTLIRMK